MDLTMVTQKEIPNKIQTVILMPMETNSDFRMATLMDFQTHLDLTKEIRLEIHLGFQKHLAIMMGFPKDFRLHSVIVKDSLKDFQKDFHWQTVIMMETLMDSQTGIPKVIRSDFLKQKEINLVIPKDFH